MCLGGGGSGGGGVPSLCGTLYGYELYIALRLICCSI